MNKVVCYVCGTSYPENDEQCPVCGFSLSKEVSIDDSLDISIDDAFDVLFDDDFNEESTEEFINNVDFGVLKDILANADEIEDADEFDFNSASSNHSTNPNTVVVKKDDNTNFNTNRKRRKKGIGLIIVLLLAIGAVLSYIVLRFFIPNDFLYEGLESFQTPVSVQTTDVTVPTEVICTEINLNTSEVQFDAIGDTITLVATKLPEESSGNVMFVSSDPNVATVDADGVVTAVDKGSAVITATCGSVSAKCDVVCTVEAIDLTMNRKEITFNAEGQIWLLYVNQVAASEIDWSSEDDTVAMVDSGKVVSVGEGTTIINATYGNKTVSCTVHCNFNPNAFIGSGEISEATGDSQ